ncbi:MAG: ABC transporter permease [Longimicrobiales bacterium]
MSEVWFRIRAVFARDGMERDLDDEFAFHLEMEERKLVAGGMSPADARRRARVEFGGVERQKEGARESWGVAWVQEGLRDLRHAARQLRRRPAFSALAATTLALGIGGTVALFSVAYGLLVRPLPVADEARLVTFWSDYDWRGVEFDFVKDAVQGFEGVAAYSNDAVTLRTDAGTDMLLATIASAELFDILGARPLLGRTFRPGDDRPGAEPSIILAHGLWQQEFGADPGIVGRRVVVDGAPTTVIGVMPAGFHFPSPDMRAWIPLDLDPSSGNYQGNGWLVLIGRLQAGTTPAQTQASLDALGARLSERFDYPERWDKSRNPFARPLREYLLGDVRPAVLLLFGAVGLLLLMACANVAALILTRTMDRTTELAVRTALGAGRVRLARQIVTESVVLGVAGGALGVLLAWASFDALVAALPLSQVTQSFADTLRLDWRALVGGVVLSVATGAAVSLVPVRALLKGDLGGASLGDRSRGGIQVRHGRAQQALVASEVLLAVVLVTGAALLARSVDRLRAVDPGMEPEGVLAVDLFLGSSETSPAERAAFFDRIVERTEALPGVTAAGLINRLPLRDGGFQAGIELEGRPDLVGEQRPTAYFRTVTPGALDALGVTAARGRDLAASDDEGSLSVALVNESFVRSFWPESEAVGRHFTTSFFASTEWQVVGVLPDVAIDGLLSEVRPAGYHPWDQVAASTGSGVLVVRATGDPMALAGPVRSLVATIDPRAAVGTVTTMDDVVDSAMAEALRLRFFLLLFSALGLVLGAVGIYGVVSYAVERRRTEFGIRMALGARPRRLLSEVVRRGMAPVALGVAGGVAVSLVAARTVASFLYEIAPTDPVSLLVAVLALLAAGTAATLIPAVRATRTPPGVSLRSE